MHRPCLRVSFDGKSEDIVVDKDEFTIGRIETCDLILNEGSISSEHAKIIKEEGEYYLVDQESLNGVFLDGKAINKEVIRTNDVYYLGKVKIEVLSFTSLLEKTHKIDVKEFWERKRFENVAHFKRNFLEILLGSFAVICGKVFEIFFTNPLSGDDIRQFITSIISNLLVVFLVSVVLSIISKIHNKSYLFSRFFLVIGLTTSAALFYTYTYTYLFSILFLSSFIHSACKIFYYLIFLWGGYFVLKTFVFPKIKTRHLRIAFGVISIFYISTYGIINHNQTDGILKKFNAHLIYPLVDMNYFSNSQGFLEKKIEKDLIKIKEKSQNKKSLEEK